MGAQAYAHLEDTIARQLPHYNIQESAGYEDNLDLGLPFQIWDNPGIGLRGGEEGLAP